MTELRQHKHSYSRPLNTGIGLRPASPPRTEFSLAHLTLLSCSPPEFTEIAAAAGYDFVSLRPIAFGLPTEPRHPLATDRDLLRRTRATLAATGVRLLDIELAKICPEVDIQSYAPALECAAELGARHVLTSIWCTDAQFSLDRFIELCELAQRFGLTVDLEFVTYAGIRTLADAVRLVSAARCKNAGICIDTLHFDRSGSSVEELRSVPRSWFHYAQICDAPAQFSNDDDSLRLIAREGRLFLGEGGIDVRGIVTSMPVMPYSIELPNARLCAELGAREFARRCLNSARRYLARRTPDSVRV